MMTDPYFPNEADFIYQYENSANPQGSKQAKDLVFPSPLNIILVNSILSAPSATGLIEFWASPLIEAKQNFHKFLFVACGNEVVGSEIIVKIAVHEVGHALRLATRDGFDPTKGGPAGGKRETAHDFGIFPSEALNDVMGANSGMVGIMNPIVEPNWEYWLRHEDWIRAWRTAKEFF